MKRQATTTQFFYQNGKLVTVNQSDQQRAIFRSTDIPLAEVVSGKDQDAGLLEVDQNGSVLKVSGDANEEDTHCYSAYGYDPSLPSLRTSYGFNGESIDALAAAYLLGSGYRLYSPVLQRFQKPDNSSPFDTGGLNAYAYCGGDPINFSDPSGHAGVRRTIQLRREQQKYTASKTALSRLEPIKNKLQNGINRDTRSLLEQRQKLSALEQAATQAKRNTRTYVADPNDWADKRRIETMNRRAAQEQQDANSRLKAARENEKFISINITEQTKKLEEVELGIEQHRDAIRKTNTTAILFKQ